VAVFSAILAQRLHITVCSAEPIELSEQVVVAVPSRNRAGRSSCGRRAELQSFALHLEGDPCVAPGRFAVGMPQIVADGVGVRPCLEHVDGRGVSKTVWMDLFARVARASCSSRVGVLPKQMAKAPSSEWLATPIHENEIRAARVDIPLLQKFSEQRRGLIAYSGEREHGFQSKVNGESNEAERSSERCSDVVTSLPGMGCLNLNLQW